MYISVGDRVRSPRKGYNAPAALGEQSVRVIDCGPSLEVCVNPGAMYVPGSTGLTSSATIISSYSLSARLPNNSAQLDSRHSRNSPGQQQGSAARSNEATHNTTTPTRYPFSSSTTKDHNGSSSSERLHHWFPHRLPSVNPGARRARRNFPLRGTPPSRRTGSASSVAISDNYLVILTYHTTAVSVEIFVLTAPSSSKRGPQAREAVDAAR